MKDRVPLLAFSHSSVLSTWQLLVSIKRNILCDCNAEALQKVQRDSVLDRRYPTDARSLMHRMNSTTPVPDAERHRSLVRRPVRLPGFRFPEGGRCAAAAVLLG